MRISAFDTFSQLSISNREENLQIQKEKDKISPSLSFFFFSEVTTAYWGSYAGNVTFIIFSSSKSSVFRFGFNFQVYSNQTGNTAQSNAVKAVNHSSKSCLLQYVSVKLYHSAITQNLLNVFIKTYESEICGQDSFHRRFSGSYWYSVCSSSRLINWPTTSEVPLIAFRVKLYVARAKERLHLLKLNLETSFLWSVCICWNRK